MTKGKALSTQTSTSDESAFEGTKISACIKNKFQNKNFVNGKQFSTNGNKIQT